MTTALAPAQAGKTMAFSSLTPGSRQMQIIAANSSGEPISEMDLTKVKTPAGGGSTWEVNDNGNITTCQEITGVLVAIGRRGVLWPWVDPKKDPPIIITNDLKVGHRVGDKLGSVHPDILEKYRTGDRTYDWVGMESGPDFGPKTGKDGIGKRVKEARVLAILRDGDVWPVLVSVGPGSLGLWLPFQKKLPCFHYEAVIGLSLRKVESKGGQPYSQIIPRLVGQLSEEQGEFVRKTYTEPLNAMFAAPPNVAAVADGDTEE